MFEESYRKKRLEYIENNRTKVGDCLEWNLNKMTGGYGSVYLRLKKPRTTSVHRAVYGLTHNLDITGYVIMHTCDNPACSNIKHLKIGKTIDNIMDCVKKKRHKNQNTKITHCKNGHELSDNNVTIWNNMRRCQICRKQYAYEYYKRKKDGKQVVNTHR